MSSTDSPTLKDALQSKKQRNADDTDAKRSTGERIRPHDLSEAERANFRVPPALWDAFLQVCEKEGRSASWVLREHLHRVVEKGETGL